MQTCGRIEWSIRVRIAIWTSIGVSRRSGSSQLPVAG
jgi:hypothetical protein